MKVINVIMDIDTKNITESFETVKTNQTLILQAIFSVLVPLTTSKKIYTVIL